MKNVLFVLLFSIISAGSFGGNIGFNFHLPQSEFKEAGVTNGFGGDFNAMYYVVDQLAFGINGGISVYDISEEEIPFNQLAPEVTVTKKTTNGIGYGHLFTKIVPFKAKVQPYMVGLIGLKNLNTVTEIRKNNNCVDDDATDYDDCEIASSTNASENAWSWGFGGGLEISIMNFDAGMEENKLMFNQSEGKSEVFGNLLFFIDAKYLFGSRAKYLKKGDIVGEVVDGVPSIVYNWSESNTDLLQINVGLSIKIN